MANFHLYSAGVAADGDMGVETSTEDEALGMAVASPVPAPKAESFSVEAESSSSNHPALWEVGAAPVKQEVDL